MNQAMKVTVHLPDDSVEADIKFNTLDFQRGLNRSLYGAAYSILIESTHSTLQLVQPLSHVSLQVV